MVGPDFDLLIIGAGISGIGSAVHFMEKCPGKSFAILEARDKIGGTWSLFKYPGIRSDSDMQTFGFKFKPWTNPKSISDAPSILAYLEEAVEEFDVGPHIRFGQKMSSADWSSRDAMWTVKTESGESHSCRFLLIGMGYYDYDKPHNPPLTGEANFKGPIIHPQHWPDDLDYKNKKVVVVGSGATAVTIIPSMAKQTKHITMLQRSPTWILPQPEKDWFANILMKILPDNLAHRLAREKNIWRQSLIYKWSMKYPERMKKVYLNMIRKSLDLKRIEDIPEHFIPKYNPWTQRLCVVPDGDLYESIKSGDASVVTDHIETIMENGIILKSGQHLDCDIIVKATGIALTVMQDCPITLDGDKVDYSKAFTYEGMMYSDVPNFAYIFGYINASWTLRVDIVADYVCRLINHMSESGDRVATPRPSEDMMPQPFVSDFNPSYIMRLLEQMPKQGEGAPWVNTQDYRRDRRILSKRPIDDGYMEFSGSSV